MCGGAVFFYAVTRRQYAVEIRLQNAPPEARFRVPAPANESAKCSTPQLIRVRRIFHAQSFVIPLIKAHMFTTGTPDL